MTRNVALTLVTILEDMAEQGFEFCMGRHQSVPTGYYAQFYKSGDECDECECERRPTEWDTAGHALSLFDAVAEARDLALDFIKKPRRQPEFFATCLVQQ